jgi:uncharacterized repeat protein (TIGR03803 family)
LKLHRSGALHSGHSRLPTATLSLSSLRSELPIRLPYCLVVLAIAAIPSVSLAQSYTESVLYSFCSNAGCSDGSNPYSNLTQASDGNLYGTTIQGGLAADTEQCPSGCGTVFKITPSGILNTVYSFCSEAQCADGLAPYTTPLIEGSDGSLYGTTSSGGTHGNGTIFKFSLSGTLTTIYSFCSQSNCADGSIPFGGVVQGLDGNFYGTTKAGGANRSACGTNGCGTVFRVTPSGTLTTLYSFCSQTNCADGGTPFAGLVQAADENFYGVTIQNGDIGYGTVFQITPDGNLTTLHTFCSQTNCADGEYPYAPLVQSSDGSFYGTTTNGGINGDACGGYGCGTVFKITPSGTLTTIHSFAGGPDDGGGPHALLMQATDGNFYSTTSGGGANNGSTGGGAAFKMSPLGELSLIYSFCDQGNCSDGLEPFSGLAQGSDGNFYGTAQAGGTNADGAAYQIAASPALVAPVQLTFSKSQVAVDSPVTLSWKVSNAFSTAMQQCYAFIENNATGAGGWSGLQTGTLSVGVYSGSTVITPTAAGVYTYALTCGGVESGLANLQAGGQLIPTANALTPNNPPIIVLGAMTPVVLTSTIVPQQTTFGPPTGTVTFTTGSKTLGVLNLPPNGSAALTLPSADFAVGTYNLTATYSGDNYYQGSVGTTSILVEAKAPTVTGASSNSPIVLGSIAIVTASAGASQVYPGPVTGSITFSYDGLVLGTVQTSTGNASLNLEASGIPIGTYVITVTYSGNDSYVGSSGNTNVTVLGHATATTIAVMPTTVIQGQSATLSARVI